MKKIVSREFFPVREKPLLVRSWYFIMAFVVYKLSKGGFRAWGLQATFYS